MISRLGSFLIERVKTGHFVRFHYCVIIVSYQFSFAAENYKDAPLKRSIDHALHWNRRRGRNDKSS